MSSIILKGIFFFLSSSSHHGLKIVSKPCVNGSAVTQTLRSIVLYKWNGIRVILISPGIFQMVNEYWLNLKPPAALASPRESAYALKL